MRRRNRRKKINIIFVLIMMVLIARVGYSALLSNLKVNGTSSVSTISWDVHFENVASTSSSNVTPTTAPSAPPSSKVTTLTYAVTFENPGDVYEFTVNVKNGGTIDAMISSFTNQVKVGNGSWSNNLPNYLDYSVKYSDDKEIQAGHALGAGKTETIKVRTGVKSGLADSVYQEAAGKTLSFQVTLNYRQADGTEKDAHGNVFVVSNNTMTIDTSIPAGINQRATPELAISDWRYIQGSYGDPIYLKHYVENNIVKESYVGIQRNNNYYYIKGGDGGAAFTTNCNTLKTLFGSSNCQTSSTECTCSLTNDELHATVTSEGRAEASGWYYDYGCYVDSNKTSKCQ